MVQLNPLKWGKKKNKLKVEKKMGSQGGRKTRYQTKTAKPLLEKRTDTGIKGGMGGKKSRYSRGTAAPTVKEAEKKKKKKRRPGMMGKRGIRRFADTTQWD